MICILHLWYCPKVLGCCVLFSVFFIIFSLYTLLWKVSVDLCSSSQILSSAITSLLMSPSKAFFIWVIVLMPSTSFWFLLRLSYHSAYITHLFLNTYLKSHPTFSIKALNIAIIVTVNFLFDNSHIYVISESGSDNCFVNWPCFVCFSLPLACLVIFCWVSDTFYLTGAEVNWP